MASAIQIKGMEHKHFRLDHCYRIPDLYRMNGVLFHAVCSKYNGFSCMRSCLRQICDFGCGCGKRAGDYYYDWSCGGLFPRMIKRDLIKLMGLR